jgi:hypothetical protein
MVEGKSKVGKIVIGNIRNLSPLVGVEDVYMERENKGILANPFVLIGDNPSDRDTVIDAFRLYFNGVLSITPEDRGWDLQIDFMKLAKDMTERLNPERAFRLARMGITTPKLIHEALDILEVKLKAGQDLRFVCWCDPLPCHTHIVRDYLLKRLEK